MNGIQLAQSLIRTSAFTLNQASKRLDKDEFYEFNLEQPSMAWTLLHISGQLEWATLMTLGYGSVQNVNLLEQFKGDTTIVKAKKLTFPVRGDVEAVFSQCVERALQSLDCCSDKWLNAPFDKDACLTFPSVAHVWKHVAFHMAWHLGLLSATYPQLLGPEYAEPPLNGYEGKL